MTDFVFEADSTLSCGSKVAAPVVVAYRLSKMHRLLHCLPIFLSLSTTPGFSAQQPQPLNWAADDGKRVAELEARGIRTEGTQAAVWMPADLMSEPERKALVDRLDRGVRALRELIGTHEWQVVRDQKINDYISADQFVSHASGRAAVFVPVARVQDGRAPFLHETGHELLARAAQRGPAADGRPRLSLWLNEGLADYVGQTAATRTGITEGDVFSVGGLQGVDRTCATRLDAAPSAAEIVQFMGAPSGPPTLFTTDRQKVAPTFYACAFSLTKFVVDRIGLADTIQLMPFIADGESLHRRLESRTGKPMSALRAEWLTAIKTPPPLR
jgi:hypothetical protein